MCVGVVVYVGVCRGSSSACEVIVGVCIRVVVVVEVVVIVVAVYTSSGLFYI